MWERKLLLIWGTTYPEFSKTYYETVCTGAIDGETGRLIRVYPITLRHMKEPFSTYDWIDAEVARNTSDFRPESFKINQQSVTMLGRIDVGQRNGWAERSRWVLRPGNVFRSVEALQQAEARDHTSLGLVKPGKIKRFYARDRSIEERYEWEQKREAALQQRDLFVDAEAKTRDLEFPSVQYRVEFSCNDAACSIVHDMSILDWGTYVLHRKQAREKGPEKAKSDVIAKLEQLMDPSRADPHFYLGNTKAHCENFMVVGLYYPPKVNQSAFPF